MKTCLRCKEEKSIKEFSFVRTGSKGQPLYVSRCKPCDSITVLERRKAKYGPRANSIIHAKTRYGLTLEQYDKMRKGPCCICGGKKKINIDHDHKTGKIRGPLCISCNMGLGHFKDNPKLLKSALEYLNG